MAKRILIIEDDVFLGDLLADRLKKAGYDVDISRDGAAGEHAMKQTPPDLLFLDVTLPTKDGYTILAEKQRDDVTRRVPVIALSHSGEPAEIDKLLSLNVKEYVVKAQFNADDVIARVHSLLKDVERDGEELSPTVPKKSKLDLSTKKVMWVEDDVFLSDIIARKLQSEGAKLVHASTGLQVMDLVEKERPDAILLDILLPGIDGFEILARLKAQPELKAIPVILLSNLGQKSDIEKGEKLGAEKFLVKATVTLDEIMDELRRVLEKKTA